MAGKGREAGADDMGKEPTGHSISDSVSFWRIDVQASWSRRRRLRSDGYEDREVARGRLMIAPIIGCNEVVLDLCREADIQTRLVFSQRSEKRRPSLLRAG